MQFPIFLGKAAWSWKGQGLQNQERLAVAEALPHTGWATNSSPVTHLFSPPKTEDQQTDKKKEKPVCTTNNTGF